MISTTLIAATLLATLPVRVAAQACPSGAEIERLLESMLPGSATSPDLARVSRQGDALHVELVGADAAVIGERSLAAVGSCAELAQVVAVVLATWESDVHPEFTPSMDLVPARTAEAKKEPDVGLARTGSLDVAASGGASVADSATFAVTLGASWFPVGTGLGLRAIAAGETRHAVTIAAHQAQWRRWVGATLLDFRLARGIATFDVHGGIALASLQATGEDYSPNQSASSLAVAPVLGGRVSIWPSRHFGLSLEVAGFYWQRSQLLESSAGSSREVPHFQGLLTLGLAARDSPMPR